MPTVIRSPQANLDLLEMWEYIAEENIGRADTFIETILETCETLALSNQMGRLREELAPNLRSFPVKSYLIFYRAIADGIEVARVLHSSRDIDNTFFP